jgi:hypothetical protein
LGLADRIVFATQPFAQLFVKMPDVKIEVLLPVELQHLFGGLQWDPLGAGPSLAMVVETVIATCFVALPPPPHGPISYPDDFGRFPALQALSHSFQNHFLHFHHPLHFCGRDHLFRVHTLRVPSASSGQITC